MSKSILPCPSLEQKGRKNKEKTKQSEEKRREEREAQEEKGKASYPQKGFDFEIFVTTLEGMLCGNGSLRYLFPIGVPSVPSLCFFFLSFFIFFFFENQRQR